MKRLKEGDNQRHQGFLALNKVTLGTKHPYLCIWCKHSQITKVADSPCQWERNCGSFLMLLKNLRPGAMRPLEQFVLMGDDCPYFLAGVSREEAVDSIGAALVMISTQRVKE